MDGQKMQRSEEIKRVIEVIHKSMLRDGISQELIDSIDTTPIWELLPKFRAAYELREKEIKLKLSRMPLLRYEFIGQQGAPCLMT